MTNDKHGLKDKVEGKITGDKARELEGKAQGAKGKATDKVNKLIDDVKDKK